MPDIIENMAVVSDKTRYDADGAICLRQAFSAQDLHLIEEYYNYRIQNLTENKIDMRIPGGGTNVTDSGNTETWKSEQFKRMFRDTPLADLALKFCGGTHLWFYYEQVFLKEGKGRRTPWHQDTSYLPVDGRNMIRFWITLDASPAESQLEFIKGSHNGVLYNGSRFEEDDDTLPLYVGSDMPILPDIQADRANWDILSWDITPGDALLFHPAILHGGAQNAEGQRRRTIALTFFGDDAHFAVRPNSFADSGPVVAAGAGESAVFKAAEFAHMKHGDPFRLPGLIQLR